MGTAYAALSGCGKFTRSPKPWQLSLQCDFGLEVAGGSAWSPDGEEGSDRNCALSARGAGETEASCSVPAPSSESVVAVTFA